MCLDRNAPSYVINHLTACFVGSPVAGTVPLRQPLIPAWFLPGRRSHLSARCLQNRNRPNSTRGPSCPRLSSIARQADHDPPAFTASRNGLPALKVGVVEAATSRLSPVLGLRPVRAGRLLVPNVPKPTIRTSSPLARVSAIASKTASTASPRRRPSDSDPVGHTARYLRLVHPFSPCVTGFSPQTIAEAGAHG